MSLLRAHINRFTLLLRGAKCFLGQAVSRKSAITPHLLHGTFVLFNFSLPLHAAMWALFLVAFFILLHKSNLVTNNNGDISCKVITRADLVFTASGVQIFGIVCTNDTRDQVSIDTSIDL